MLSSANLVLMVPASTYLELGPRRFGGDIGVYQAIPNFALYLSNSSINEKCTFTYFYNEILKYERTYPDKENMLGEKFIFTTPINHPNRAAKAFLDSFIRDSRTGKVTLIIPEIMKGKKIADFKIGTDNDTKSISVTTICSISAEDSSDNFST